jgi:serine beta-lactamase-like protein LACTB, mitochondrial
VLQTALLLSLLAQSPAQKADQAIFEFKIEHQIVGLACAVYADNRLVYVGQAGQADRENQKPVTGKTWFRLGSISKPVTAVGAMKLAEKGKLDLDVDCRKYIPEWPAAHAKVTLRQILSHTAGVRHYQPKGDPDGKLFYPTAAGAVGVFVKDPLRFEPGKMYSYSTHGYTLVARAMETASGSAFQDYMRTEIFPAAKGELDVEILTEKRDRSALYGMSGGEAKLQTPREDNSWKFGGGGMEATASGLATFCNEVLHARVVGAESMRQMWSSTKLNDGTFSNYGLGFRLMKPGGVVGHNGAQQGCRTAMLMDLNQRTVAVMLANTEGSWDPTVLARKLLDLAPELAKKN